MAYYHKPGEVVTASGLYKAEHSKRHVAEFSHTLAAGQVFPECKVCGTGVSYLLIQSASEMERANDADASRRQRRQH